MLVCDLQIIKVTFSLRGLSSSLTGFPETPGTLDPGPAARVAAVPFASLGEWRGRTHTVAGGETLLGIAAALRVPIDALLAANRADVHNPDLIWVGQTLRVPEAARFVDDGPVRCAARRSRSRLLSSLASLHVDFRDAGAAGC